MWFLPLWLRPEWYDTDRYNQKGEQVPCTTAEMSKAINGYLGLSHAYFAPDNDIMQEGITVRQWRDRYELQCQTKKQPPSNYAGYAYDAMWTYAYAMDRLLRENQSYVFDLHSNHTINRLTDIIGETDFYGVRNEIKFRSIFRRFCNGLRFIIIFTMRKMIKKIHYACLELDFREKNYTICNNFYNTMNENY